MFACQVNFDGDLMICCTHILQFGNILYGALLLSVMIQSLIRRFVKRHARATLQYPGSQGTSYGGGMSVARENNKLKNVSPGSQVPHKAFFSPNQPGKVSCLLCSVDLLVVSASLRRKKHEENKFPFKDKSCN